MAHGSRFSGHDPALGRPASLTVVSALTSCTAFRPASCDLSVQASWLTRDLLETLVHGSDPTGAPPLARLDPSGQLLHGVKDESESSGPSLGPTSWLAPQLLVGRVHARPTTPHAMSATANDNRVWDPLNDIPRGCLPQTFSPNRRRLSRGVCPWLSPWRIVRLGYWMDCPL